MIAFCTKLHRTPCLGCTGAFPNTTASALDALFGKPPFDTDVCISWGCTMKAIYHRRRGGFWCNSHWSFDDLARHLLLSYNPGSIDMVSDAMTPEFRLCKFRVDLLCVQDWFRPESEPGLGRSQIFTDGSKTGQSGLNYCSRTFLRNQRQAFLLSLRKERL